MKLKYVMILFILFASISLGYALTTELALADKDADINVTEENNFTHLNISDNSLVLYMPFDVNTSSTKVYDYSGNNNDGTANGDAHYIKEGWIGGAYDFDGNGDRIQIDYTNPTTFTLVGWFKKQGNGNGGVPRIWGTTDPWSIEIGIGNTVISNNFGYFIGGVSSGWTSAFSVSTNVWYHFAVVWDGSGPKVYENGVLVHTGALSGSINQRPTQFIGGETLGDYFNGLIDEVMIFNRSLNSTEISDIYNNQSERFYPRGEQVFRNINLSETGTENKVDVSLEDCQTFMNTEFNATIGVSNGTEYVYNGTIASFSNCNATNLTIEGNPENVSLKIIYASDSYQFYSPVLIGNITLDSYTEHSENESLHYTLNFPQNNSREINLPVNLSINITSSSGGLMNVSFFGSSKSEFVSAEGDNFKLGNSRFRFLGTNAYYLVDYATNLTYDDDGNQINDSRKYAVEILDEAQSLGFNVIRIWAFASGDSRIPLGGKYNLFEIGTPGNYSEQMMKSLDWVVYEAEKRDMRVLPVLINNWNPYGGMEWYVNKSPSTNKSLLGDEFHDQFYSDENCRQYYRNYVANLLNRTNTYTGVKYKDDPAIFAWALTNEARAKSDGNRNQGILLDWIENMSIYLKSLDSEHMVTAGIEGWGTPWEGTAFIIDHDIPEIDFATFTLYPDSWSWFGEWSEYSNGSYVGKNIGKDPIDWWTNDSNVTWDRWNPYEPELGRFGFDNWIKQNCEWAEINLSKPVVLQEIGLKDDYSNELRGRFYNQTIHTFFSNGGDGLFFWNLNHDNYYYSTNENGSMDDGYGFYVSDNAFLKNKSLPILEAVDFTKTDNNGGSWINAEEFTELCSFKNIENGSDVNCIWNNLSKSTTYRWFINIASSFSNTSSIVWNFTTVNYEKPLLSGSGTEEDPYQITNCTDLQAMDEDLDAHYILMNDINCSDTVNWNNGSGFDPIGKIYVWPEDSDYAFTGVFDGKGHKITGLYIANRSGPIGLFGWTWTGKTRIRNVGVEDVYIESKPGYAWTGALVGLHIGGKIENCYSTGIVTGKGEYVGGLVGQSNNPITNSYSTANVSGVNCIGGLVGRNFGHWATISNCYATGSVSGTSWGVGGLIGYQLHSNRISNCFATGKVSGPNARGLIGKDEANYRPINFYWNNNTENPDICIGQSSQRGCSVIQDNESYFKGDVFPYNQPMRKWDFYNTWIETDSFPILAWQAGKLDSYKEEINSGAGEFEVDGKAETDTILNISINDSVSGGIASIIKYTTDPTNSTSHATGLLNLSKYIVIETTSDISSSMKNATIRVYYTDEEVAEAGANESELRLYRFNGTEWVKYDAPNGGVNTAENYVWAITSEFSTWGVFAEPEEEHNPVIICPETAVDDEFIFEYSLNDYKKNKKAYLQIGYDQNFKRKTYRKLKLKKNQNSVKIKKQYKNLVKLEKKSDDKKLYARIAVKTRKKEKVYSNVCEFKLKKPEPPFLKCPIMPIDSSYSFVWDKGDFNKFSLQIGYNEDFKRKTYIHLNSKTNSKKIRRVWKKLKKLAKKSSDKFLRARVLGKNKYRQKEYSNACEFEIETK